MKNINKYLFLFLAGFFITSCDEDLDINRDPSFPEEINAGVALTSAEGTLAAVVGGEFMNLGGFYAEYHTQAPSASQYETIDSYNLNTTYANTPWTLLYSGVLRDLQYVTEESTEAGDTATLLMAEVLRGYTYQYLVDLFDDVPYTEALQAPEGNITPNVTPGEEIYADVIEKIDAAIAAYEANPTTSATGTQDIIFSSDMSKWIQFANTLKLRMYIRMAYTPQANPTAVTALLADGNFLTEDAKFDLFVASANRRNPFYEVFLSQTGLGDINHVASDAIRNFYVANNDPRLQAAFRPGAGGSFGSISQGTGNDFNTVAGAYARPNVRPRTPVFFMTVSESNFLQAEALIRYSGGAGAKERYDAGVLASFMTYQANFFSDTDATREEDEVWTPSEAATHAATLTGPGGAYEYVAGGSVESSVRQVIIQKWAAMPYVNNIEAFIESTRTKYPEIVEEGTENYAEGNRIPSAISILPGTTIPSILFYPESEVNRNPNIQQRSSVTENVWWDQKPE